MWTRHGPDGLLRLYRRLRYGLASTGTGCRFERNVRIYGGRNISLDNEVRLGFGALLDARTYGTGKIRIGDRSEIFDSARLFCYGGSIEIGADCSVNPYAILYGLGGLKIGNNVRIAARSVLVPGQHRFARLDIPVRLQGESRKGITVEDDVWIGAGVIVLDGVTIGEQAVVGAGAVVTKSVPARHVVAGVPARTLRVRGDQ